MKYKKILIIEDEPDIVKALAKRLSMADYHVFVAPNVKLGVSEAQKTSPDLIILDLMIPGGGGFGVLERLSFSANTKEIPVLVLTGMLNEDYKNDVKKGVAGFLEKPYDPVTLLAEVKRILGEEKGDTALSQTPTIGSFEK